MTSERDHHDHTRHEPQHPSPTSPGELLRCAADEELDAEAREALRRHLEAHPEDQARIDFERELRQSCARVMGRTTAPERLRTRIAALAAEHRDEATPPKDADRPAEPPAPIPFPVRATRAAVAAAAILVIAAAGVMVWTIGQRPGQETPATASSMTLVADFVAEEHERCAKDPARVARKLTAQETAKIPESLANVLGRTPTIPDLLGAGLQLEGAGRCGVPGGLDSIHMLFTVAGETEFNGHTVPDGTRVSLFIQRGGANTEKMKTGRTYLVRCSPGQRCERTGGPLIWGWRDDELTYYLVADVPEATSGIGRAVGLDEPTGSL